jgi:flavin reductase (DIM6/NTAB) family NADH-FMN oxidoreductase RutF
MITGSRSFGVTILSSEQTGISSIFAGQIGDDEDRFAGLETKRLISGTPMITGGIAYLDCNVFEIYEFASNSLIIGEVIAAEVGENVKPLLYFDQQYHKLQE